MVELPEITVISCYFPNSQGEGRRLGYKLDYCSAILETCRRLASENRRFVICGDFNIAHRPIDLARPKENEGSAGYLPEERAWMEAFLNEGFVDTFRLHCDEPGNYTWWSYIGRAREKNIGWRLDYHCVPEYMRSSVVASEILSDVMGSDHCPVLIRLDL
jgi:exodeoxyribonuclease-3